MPTPTKDVVIPVSPSSSSVTAFTLATETGVAIAASTDTQLLAANTNRRMFNIVNMATSDILYLTFAGAAAGPTKFPIPAGGSFSACVSNDGKMIEGEIRGYCATAQTVGVLEFT